jgi:hypothetical protein
MSAPSDAWYIRLPDGRVVMARSTAAVRHHLETGVVPLDCRVRRSPLESWSSLAKVEAFADLAVFSLQRGRKPETPPSGEVSGASRGNHLALQAVGVRELMAELLSALDSTFVPGKLLAAALGLFFVALIVVAGGPLAQAADLDPRLVRVAQGLLILVVFATCAALVDKLTVVELAHFRPARWDEARAGLAGNVVRLTLTYLLAGGATLLLMLLLRRLPGWLHEQVDGSWPAEAAAVLVLFLEVALWVMLGLSLLLGPVLIVEECSVGAALRQWGGLLRRHLGRVLMYEYLALVLAALAALPLLIPVELATLILGPEVAAAAYEAVWLLRGLALTPGVAYLLVANVFIYLALRYEHTPVR